MMRFLTSAHPRRAIPFLLAALVMISAPLRVDSNDISISSDEKSMSTTNIPQNQTAPTTPYDKASNPTEAMGEGQRAPTVSQEQQTFEAPYPFTPDELWQKLLKVVELPEGHVTKQQVESIFDVRLQLIDQTNWQFKTDYPRYSVERGRDWYFDLVLAEESPTLSHFHFRWGQDPGRKKNIPFPPPPHSMCIVASNIMPDIEQRGWKLKYEHRLINYPPYSNTYTKGKLGKMELVFSSEPDDCLLSVHVAVVRKPDKVSPVKTLSDNPN